MYKKNIKLHLCFLLLLLPLGCGFEVLNKSKINTFTIQEIRTGGDNRISQKIKNNLLSYTDRENQKNLIVYLNSKKSKTIKEKNIKNQITKYQIKLDIQVSIQFIGTNQKMKKMNFSASGDYPVAKIHSISLSNEKKLIDNLIENISTNILDEIELKLNDI